jgi:DNA-binding NarL/FixJ family response regulator
MTAIAIQVRSPIVRAGTATRITAEAGCTVVMASASVVDLLIHTSSSGDGSPDVVIVECDSEGAVEALGAVLGRWPETRVIGLHSDLPPAGIAALREAGMACLVDRASGMDALLAAVREPDRPTKRRWVPPTLGPVPLTEREAAVLALIASGLTAREVAERLEVSLRTVEAHKQRAFAKLGVQNQAHAVAAALANSQLSSTGRAS